MNWIKVTDIDEAIELHSKDKLYREFYNNKVGDNKLSSIVNTVTKEDILKFTVYKRSELYNGRSIDDVIEYMEKEKDLTSLYHRSMMGAVIKYLKDLRKERIK